MQKLSILQGVLVIAISFPNIALAQTFDENKKQYSFDDIVFNFDSRVKQLEDSQESISNGLDQNTKELRELESSASGIFKRIIERLGELEIENADLRQELESLSRNKICIY